VYSGPQRRSPSTDDSVNEIDVLGEHLATQEYTLIKVGQETWQHSDQFLEERESGPASLWAASMVCETT
jgi:hypothetical protein